MRTLTLSGALGALLVTAGCPASTGPGVTTVTPRPVDHADVATRLLALPDPNSGDWDDAVAAELLATFDADKSGSLDRVAEIRAITCDVWRALEDRTLSNRDSGVAVIYGFGDGLEWVGSALGFAQTHRPVAADAALACGLELSGFATAFDPSLDYDAAASGTDGDVPSAIAALSAKPESGAWDDAVTAILLAAYDHDRSERLDQAREVEAIGCPTLERLVWAAPNLVTTYGIAPSYAWVGDALGFDEVVRDELYARFSACGFGDDSYAGDDYSGGDDDDTSDDDSDTSDDDGSEDDEDYWY